MNQAFHQDQRARLFLPRVQPEPLPIQPIRVSPCSEACPAGINVKSYVSLIAEGRFADALEVIRQRCPLPGICGRVCHHPCETACKRGEYDEPVAIRALKRFVADLELELPPLSPPQPAQRRERVAVIGSGPAGLTAAYDLRLAGYRVKVFEAESEPGGMLRHGIADYRLPPEVLEAEIGYLTRAGIQIRTGCRIGADLTLEELLGRGYSAVVLAVGAQQGRQLGVPGEDDCGEIEDALAFLRRVNAGDRSPVEDRVLVIGGGSSAVEAARSACRLGARSVEILYRRSNEELLASEEEIEVAKEEGVAFRFLTAPVRVVSENGGLKSLECVRVALGEPDASGRRRPIPIPGSEFRVDADRVVTAVGQQTDLDFLPQGIVERLTNKGKITIEPETTMTALRGVFAAGDVVSGPATVVEAIGTGHRAAEAIQRFLEHGDSAASAEHPWKTPPTEYELPLTPSGVAARISPPHTGIVADREFEEAEEAFSAQNAVAEAQRCLRCGPCSECRVCAASCGRRHLMIRLQEGNGARPAETMLLRAPARIVAGLGADPTPGSLLGDQRAARAVDVLPARVTVGPLLCRGCARCLEICPFDAISLLDPTAPETTVRVEPALCRGCNLCAAVCPTDALLPTALTPDCWGLRPSELHQLALRGSPGERPYVVLACERRGLSEGACEKLGPLVQVVAVRCVGQVDAGMLLELYRRGAKAILLAGCLADRCRFGCGSRLAREQVSRADAVLRTLGIDPGHVVSDWSGEPAGDGLDLPILRLIAERHESLALPAAQSGVT